MNNGYKLLDSGNFKKLEQIGPYRIVRPAAQAIWKCTLPTREWEKIDAIFLREGTDGGKWQVKNKTLPESWVISLAGLKFIIHLTGFGHLGIFPEQEQNWLEIRKIVDSYIHQSKSSPQILNLFAYTGGSTLAAALAGAEVVHLDASKTTVAWAKENSALQDREFPVRWIVDDASKFIARQSRKNARFHGLILDPPSFGRGPNGQVWKIENQITSLLGQLKDILEPEFLFILITSHTPGFTPQTLKNLVQEMVGDLSGQYLCQEMLIKEEASGRFLPSGSSCFFVRGR